MDPRLRTPDLVRDLTLAKEASEVLASRLSKHGILDSKIKITFYRHRDEALSDYFTKEDNFVFCKNVKRPSYSYGCSPMQTG